MGGGDDSIDGFVTAAIGPVLEYDRRRGTVLGQTLESYFAAGGSPARAAELLHVHVNTVTQRLERLSTLLGEDWQRPDRALEIQLALRLHRLRASGLSRGVEAAHMRGAEVWAADTCRRHGAPLTFDHRQRVGPVIASAAIKALAPPTVCDSWHVPTSDTSPRGDFVMRIARRLISSVALVGAAALAIAGCSSPQQAATR